MHAAVDSHVDRGQPLSPARQAPGNLPTPAIVAGPPSCDHGAGASANTGGPDEHGYHDPSDHCHRSAARCWRWLVRARALVLNGSTLGLNALPPAIPPHYAWAQLGIHMRLRIWSSSVARTASHAGYDYDTYSYSSYDDSSMAIGTMPILLRLFRL